jgi:hypothetical protein
MAQPLGIPYSYFADANGAPLAGGLIYTYTAGTLTPLATYTDSSLGTPLPNPVVLDSAGRKTIWLSGTYKIIVKDALGNTISTTDNITATGSGGDMTVAVYDPAGITEQLVGLSATQTLANKKITIPDITGVTNGGDANVGSVGEYMSASVGSVTTGLTTGVTKNITTLSLSAGDWDVWGTVILGLAATTTSNQFTGGINTTSATLPGVASGAYSSIAATLTAGGNPSVALAVGPLRVNVASPTTVYLVANATFATSTAGAYGFIGARRRR